MIAVALRDLHRKGDPVIVHRRWAEPRCATSRRSLLDDERRLDHARLASCVLEAIR